MLKVDMDRIFSSRVTHTKYVLQFAYIKWCMCSRAERTAARQFSCVAETFHC